MSSSEATCIIPTRNRSSFLNRALYFLRSANFASPLIIADSSNDEEHAKNRAVVDSHGDAGLLRYKEDLGFYRKLAAAIGEVKTPYFYFMADDDFIFPEGADACVKALAGEEELASCAGTLLVYNLDRDFILSQYLNHPLTEYPSQNDLGVEAVRRVANHIANYKATFYSVYKTQPALRAFDQLSLVCNNMRLAELFSSAFIIASGKRRVVPGLFGVRVSHNEAGHRFVDTIREMLHQPTFLTEFRAVFDSLCAFIDPQMSDGNRGLLEDSLSKYLARTGLNANELALTSTALLNTTDAAERAPALAEDDQVMSTYEPAATHGRNSPAPLNASLLTACVAMCEAAPFGFPSSEEEAFRKSLATAINQSLVA